MVLNMKPFCTEMRYISNFYRNYQTVKFRKETEIRMKEREDIELIITNEDILKIFIDVYLSAVFEYY